MPGNRIFILQFEKLYIVPFKSSVVLYSESKMGLCRCLSFVMPLTNADLFFMCCDFGTAEPGQGY
jgi:hypothetical protein